MTEGLKKEHRELEIVRKRTQNEWGMRKGTKRDLLR